MRHWRGIVRSMVSGCIRILVATGLTSVAFGYLARVAPAFACVNEARRVEQGSTYLPDCRAYELITPAEKGATQALTFTKPPDDKAAVAEDGERIALQTPAYLGGDPGSHGSNIVFSRAASGWEMLSLQAPGAGETNYSPNIFNAKLTEVGVESSSDPGYGVGRSPAQTFWIGPPGVPYRATVSSTPFHEGEKFGGEDHLVGASEDFSHIVLRSRDGTLVKLREGETTDPDAQDLYEWFENHLNLVNVTNEGKLLNECGASLGFGQGENLSRENEAVSMDGSKIFFTSPDQNAEHEESEPGCTGREEQILGVPPQHPARVYMRVDGTETVVVSAPEKGVTPPETYSAFYQGASRSGERVFFLTKTELTADDLGHNPKDLELYEYNTVTRTLTRISRGEPGTPFSTVEGKMASGNYGTEGGLEVVVSEDGSTVYFAAEGQLTPDAPVPASEEYNLYRYDAVHKTINYVATIRRPQNQGEPAYATPDGRFYLFPSTGVAGEPRGKGIQEMYRYDSESGVVMCVSCGSSVAPSRGDATTPYRLNSIIQTPDQTPRFIPMSGAPSGEYDGSYVFFESTARLVPQDTNSTEESSSEIVSPTGQDVYEWEEEGVGGCTENIGCTHLITSGKDEHISVLLGASADGSNVFFATAARLVPQDKDDLGDIYDARVDGGFPASSAPVQCSGEACRLIPSASPLIATPLSVTFSGAGNVAPPTIMKIVPRKHKTKRKAKTKAKLKTRRKSKSGRTRARGFDGTSGLAKRDR